MQHHAIVKHLVSITSLVLLTLGSAGCASQRTPSPTLYTELGGQDGVAAIVENMLYRVIEDERINYTFASANIPRLRGLLEEQFCEISDGPCDYTGFSMLESHRGMNITNTEFNALVEALIAAMEDQGLSVPVQNRLIARLAPMNTDIVYN